MSHAARIVVKWAPWTSFQVGTCASDGQPMRVGAALLPSRPRTLCKRAPHTHTPTSRPKRTRTHQFRPLGPSRPRRHVRVGIFVVPTVSRSRSSRWASWPCHPSCRGWRQRGARAEAWAPGGGGYRWEGGYRGHGGRWSSRWVGSPRWPTTSLGGGAWSYRRAGSWPLAGDKPEGDGN